MSFVLEVNWLAVIVAAVATLFLGWVWYSPFVFGKLWSRLSGTENSMDILSLILMLGGSIVTIFVINLIFEAVAVANVMDALITGFWLWLGFHAVFSLGPVLWEKKPWTLFFLNAAYHLVAVGLISFLLVTI